ncbi:hypothetical protein CS8_030280 [Cupriavidus sp. 8B]
MYQISSELRISLDSTLALQRRASQAHPMPGLDERRKDLQTLGRFIRTNKHDICAAISADYGNRSQHETLLLEIFPVIDAIDHALKHLARWMRPQYRGIDRRLFFGARNQVIPQPLGVVGVIVPWNFPVNLSLMPLVYIFAAGNRAMVKMSENSRALARLLVDRIPAYFPPEKPTFFDEAGDVGIAFSGLPFDHLLFTGSSQTGRAVMAAAARNLCPVTLELGGKAPAIVCDDFPLPRNASCTSNCSIVGRYARQWITYGCLKQRSMHSSSSPGRSCRLDIRRWIRPTTPRSLTIVRSRD